MLWLAGILFLGLRWIIRKNFEKTDTGNTGKSGRSSSKSSGGRAKIEQRIRMFVPFSLLVLGVCALAYAPLFWGDGSVGAYAAFIIEWPVSWIASLFEAPTHAFATVLLILLMCAAVVDIWWNGKPDGFAKAFVLLTPALVLIASGAFAGTMQEVIVNIAGIGPDFVAELSS